MPLGVQIIRALIGHFSTCDTNGCFHLSQAQTCQTLHLRTIKFLLLKNIGFFKKIEQPSDLLFELLAAKHILTGDVQQQFTN